MTLSDFIARLFSHTRAAAENDLPPELAALAPQGIDLVVATAACKHSLNRKISL